MAKKKFIGQLYGYDRYKMNNNNEEIKLDVTDKKILYILSKNARYSNTHIAKSLRLNRETVAYRILKMQDNELLHGFMSHINTKQLGYKQFIVNIKLKTLCDQRDILDYLLNQKYVTSIKDCSGAFDLQFFVHVMKDEDFDNMFREFINTFYEFIHSHDILVVIDDNYLGLDFLYSGDKLINRVERKGSSFQKYFDKQCFNKDIKLDDKDKLILEILKLDARARLTEISNKVGIATTATERRIQKLIEHGVIKSFFPRASFGKIGYQWFNVFFQVKNLDENKFLTFLKMNSNVLWYMKVIGKWNYHFSIFAKNNIEYQRILDQIRSEFPDNILSYESVVVFNQFKYDQKIY